MTFDRRTMLAATAALGLVPALPRAARAAETIGAEMRTRATALLGALDGAQRTAATFPFASDQRVAWNFMLGSNRAPGLALEQMTPDQKVLAMELLASGTSSLGFEKAENIMLQQDILRDEWGKGRADRNRERFSVQVYGAPDPQAPWSWRWEGHHLSLTFTMVGDAVVSMTPSSYSSEPNTVPSGPHEGLVVLKEEEALGRRLFSDLDGSTRDAALVWPDSPGNIRSNSGREARVAGQNAGVPLADLSPSQRDIALRLIEVYTQEVMPGPLAARQRERLAEEDPDAIRFAWGGADLGGSIYYRLTGRTFLIEFASLRNQPLHLHAVFHDLRHNFGRGYV